MSYETTSEQLSNPISSAISDVEELVKATATLGDEKFGRLRTKAEESFRSVKARITDTQDNLRLKAMYAVDAIDERVSSKPWESIGAVAVGALAVGFLAGMCVRRD
jgi:ElaB/YqjD/DUF883 family membrane-anchored ribosome-binding protein